MSQQNNQDPWGRRNNDGPPDLFALLKRLFSNNSGRSFSSGGGTGSVGKGAFVIVPLVLFGLYAVSGIFIVKPSEQAVVLRFGHYSRTVDQGPHWAPPLIDKQTTIDVQGLQDEGAMYSCATR